MPIIPWKVIDSRYILRDRWLTLRADRCETASGIAVDPYYVEEPPDWVHIVAFDRSDRILITCQYRHGGRIISRELPCGTVEPGETALAAARRELLEETGCAAQTFVPLPVLSPNPAKYSNKLHPFIATGTEPVQAQHLDATEDIDLEFLPIPEVLTLIDTGDFAQALHIAGLLLALRTQGHLHLHSGPAR